MNTTLETTINKEQNFKQIIKKLNFYMSQPSPEKPQLNRDTAKLNDIKEAWSDEQALSDYKW